MCLEINYLNKRKTKVTKYSKKAKTEKYLGVIFYVFLVEDVHLFPQTELLQLNCCVLDEHHVARLDESVDQLLTEAGQLVLVDDRKT